MLHTIKEYLKHLVLLIIAGVLSFGAIVGVVLFLLGCLIMEFFAKSVRKIASVVDSIDENDIKRATDKLRDSLKKCIKI